MHIDVHLWKSRGLGIEQLSSITKCWGFWVCTLDQLLASHTHRVLPVHFHPIFYGENSALRPWGGQSSILCHIHLLVCDMVKISSSPWACVLICESGHWIQHSIIQLEHSVILWIKHQSCDLLSCLILHPRHSHRLHLETYYLFYPAGKRSKRPDPVFSSTSVCLWKPSWAASRGSANHQWGFLSGWD